MEVGMRLMKTWMKGQSDVALLEAQKKDLEE